MKSAKNKKNELRKDIVNSKSFHVGIELETFIPCESENREHDGEACYEAERDRLNDMRAMDILQDYIGLSRDNARLVESYFNHDEWVSDYMQDFCCDDECCPHYTSDSDGDYERDLLEESLIELTGNKSFKVVSDGSISHASDETDAEVCWNYFASKETLKDNARILMKLVDWGAQFNRSCGLHINLNNYLSLEMGEGEGRKIPTSKLDFLFNFVAPSRRDNSYCSRYGLSDSDKYSMLYFQGDRIEFRFFSPTFDAVKLNHYVHLAHVVYKRLCGKKAKLSKKAMTYFLEKMTKVNGVSLEEAEKSIKLVNSLNSYEDIINSNGLTDTLSKTIQSLETVAV